ncbi:ATP-binding protein [Caminibacter pacificus]
MKISLSIKIAVLVMITSFIGIITLSYVSYSQAEKIFIQNSKDRLNQKINQYTEFIKNQITSFKYDINTLSYNPLIKGLVRAYNDPYKYDPQDNKTYSQFIQDVISTFNIMLTQNKSYYQIRILDIKGNELIKLIKDKNKIISLKENSLQNKSNMKYFKETIKYPINKIYISEINLNREYGQIEFPIKPTIRIAKIIENNTKTGAIVIININITKAFDFEKLRKSPIKTYIANNEGYYIFNSTNPNKEFGFEFGKDFKITNDFPFIKELYNSTKDVISFIDTKQNKIYEAKKVYLSPDRFLVILQVANASLFKQKANDYFNTIAIYIFGSLIFITLITIISVKILTNPIKKLTETADKIAKTKGKKHIKIDIKSNDEIGELANAFQIMLNALTKSQKEIEHFAQNLEKEVEKKTKELQKINKNLQKMVEEKVNELREKDKALIQQSKMAAMGEMIGAIAHQWRQPLNALALNIQMLEDLAEDEHLDKETLKEFIKKNMETIKFMSNTIDDFRNFFRKDKEKTIFDIKDIIQNTLHLQRAQLKNHDIEVIENLESAKIEGYKNELMQAILNIISNAKDAIDERRKKEKIKGIIKISTKKDGDNVIIEIEDNGGGIDLHYLDKIFEPYFTTKEEGKGTGMGLYMVKEIIERNGGKIEVANTKEGAKFKIILKAKRD